MRQLRTVGLERRPCFPHLLERQLRKATPKRTCSTHHRIKNYKNLLQLLVQVPHVDRRVLPYIMLADH